MANENHLKIIDFSYKIRIKSPLHSMTEKKLFWCVY